MEDSLVEKRPAWATTLRDYLRVVNKRKWYLLLLAGATIVAILLWTLRQTPIYQAKATLIIDATAPAVLGSNVEEVVEVGSGNYWADQEYYTTQYRVLESRTLAESVVRALGLHQNPDFLGIPANKRRGWRGASISQTAQAVLARLDVQPVRASRLVELRFEDADPRRATLLANTLAEVYIQHNLDYRLASTVQALDWLSQQLDDLRNRLEDSEVALHAFKRDNNVLSLSLEDRQNILSTEIAELSRSLTAAKTQRVDLDARLRQVREVRDIDPLELPARILLENSTLVALKAAYSNASEEQAAIASRYGENHPMSQAAAAKVASIRTNMSKEVRSVIGALDRDLRATAQAEGSLQGLLEQAQREALELNRLEIDYSRLEREEKNNEEIYGIVLKRTKETDLSKMLRTNNIRVLDPAIVPSAPIRPNLPTNLALALAVGLIAGLALCFFVEHLDNTLKSKEEAETVLAVPFLGLIPRVGTGSAGYGYTYGSSSSKEEKGAKANGNGAADRDTYVATHPKSAVAECCRSIRTNLLFLGSEKPLRTVLVTSSGPQEGKTSTSVSLAITMAQGNNRTLLIDTDMRRPRLHRIFGLGTDLGISSVIIGAAGLGDAIKPTGVDNLWVLPCGPIPPNPAELLHTEAFRQLLSSASQLFDRVVLDSPPVNVVTDAAIIGTTVDGVLLVVRAGKTAREAARAARHLLSAIGARILGVVLNDVDLSKRGGDYYQQHYYYYSHYGTAESEPVAQSAEPRH